MHIFAPIHVGGIPTTADERPARAAVVALPGPAVAHEQVARLGVRRVVQVPQALLLGEDVRARVRAPVDGPLGPEAVAAIAEARGVPRAQVALAWMLSKPFVTSPIVGATKPQHLEDAIAAAELALTDAEIEALEAPYTPRELAGHA